MELANYIYRIIRSQLMVMLSWGFCNPVALKNGLMFTTSGYKHKGEVIVELTPLDEFRVTLVKKGVTVNVIDGVYVDNLVQVIDNAVERVPNYAQRVKDEYSLTRTRA